MKRLSFLWLTLALCGAPVLRAQDAATEERLNKLSGQIENILETQQSMNKRIDALVKDMESLRDQASAKPADNYATQIEALTKAIQEVDRKRIQDAANTKSELEKIRASLLQEPKSSSGKRRTQSTPDQATLPDKQQGFEYTIKSGDTLLAISQAYREQKIKVSVDDILKANPGLRADRLVVGKTIFIPAPKP